MAKKRKAKADRPSDADMVSTIADRGAEREKIQEIETQIARADKKRQTNKEAKDFADAELQTMEVKLNEILHNHYDELSEEEDGKGTKLRVYRRGDFYAAVAAKESVKYEITKPKPQKEPTK